MSVNVRCGELTVPTKNGCVAVNGENEDKERVNGKVLRTGRTVATEYRNTRCSELHNQPQASRFGAAYVGGFTVSRLANVAELARVVWK